MRSKLCREARQRHDSWPWGAESRCEVQLGFSLPAPCTRYPDHHKPPAESSPGTK
ncbi:dimethylsulfonioproprionate lyase family protein [Trinickia sp. YCB016]